MRWHTRREQRRGEGKVERPQSYLDLPSPLPACRHLHAHTLRSYGPHDDGTEQQPGIPYITPPNRRDDSGAAFSGAFPCSVTGHAVPEVVEFLLTSTVFFTGADDVAQLIHGDPRSVTRCLPVVGFGERLAEDVADALGIPARK